MVMANVFSSLSSLLKPLSGQQGSESVLGVDIGSSSIKVVQLKKRRGAPVLETYGELALGPYANSEVGRATNLQASVLSAALKDILREANVTTANAAFSIPFASSLISLIQMPVMAGSELSRMIPIEARKYIPVPISEVVLDWFTIPDEEARYLSSESNPQQGVRKVNVLLVAIHNDTLTKFRSVAEEAGLASSFFEIEIFSAVRAALEQGIAPVMVIDLGAATTKMYVVEYGIVRLSHSVNRGGQDITLSLSRSLNVSVAKAEQLKREYGLVPSPDAKGVSEAALLTIQHIFSEANRTLLSFEKRFNKSVNSVLLVGGGAVTKGLLEFAARQFSAEVRLGDPFAKVEAPAFLQDVLRQAGPEFAVAMGLALRKLQESS